MVRSSRRAVNQEKYRNSVKLNQKLEGDGCPITWWVAIDETLSLNRAVTGIAVSCNGSSVFTTSQGMFSCPKSGLPRIGKCPSSWTWSRAVLRVPSPHRIHFEQWVCDVLLQFCVVCHEKIPFCCWECFPEFKGWDKQELTFHLPACGEPFPPQGGVCPEMHPQPRPHHTETQQLLSELQRGRVR